MYIKDLQSTLISLKGKKIILEDIGKALGTTGANISKRINAKNPSKLTAEELVKIEKHFMVKLPGLTDEEVTAVNRISIDAFRRNSLKNINKEYEKFIKSNPELYGECNQEIQMYEKEDCINVEYIGISPSCGAGALIIDEPEITPIKLSNSLITHILKCSHPENLKVFKAQGDSMETIIEDGDLLLVDIGRTDVYNAGIYVFSIDNEWRVKRFRRKIDKVLEIISDNPKYDIEFIMPDSEISLIIRGKVIKNLSRGL